MKYDNYISDLNTNKDIRLDNLDRIYEIISNFADSKEIEIKITTEEKQQLLETLKIAYIRRKVKLIFANNLDIEFNKNINRFVEHLQKINNFKSTEKEFLYFRNKKELKQYEQY